MQKLAVLVSLLLTSSGFSQNQDGQVDNAYTQAIDAESKLEANFKAIEALTKKLKEKKNLSSDERALLEETKKLAENVSNLLKEANEFDDERDEALEKIKEQAIEESPQHVGDAKLDENDFTDTLAHNQVKVINLTKKKVRLVRFNCTLSTALLGLERMTSCSDKLFTDDYPHKTFHWWENIFSYRPYGNAVKNAETPLPSEPISKLSLAPHGSRNDVKVFTMPKIEYGTKRIFVLFPTENTSVRKGEWIYVTVHNESDECKRGDKFLGQVGYTGHWSRSYTSDTSGWISPTSEDSPKYLVISSKDSSPCDFYIQGMRR